MGLLSVFKSVERLPVIFGDGVVLQYPQMADYEAWRDLRETSQDFLKPWEPLWLDDELTRAAFRQRIHCYDELVATDAAYPYFIFRTGDQRLLGGVTLSHVRRGVAQSATIGYWIGAPHTGQGYMTRALVALNVHAFGPLNLHRIDAACMPRNTASIKLLERTGFIREGAAQSYLKIAGKWEDHLLWGKISDR